MNRFKAFLLLFVTLLLIEVHDLQAQSPKTIRVNVAVVDEENRPLPGAVVRIKGKQQGMAADAKGMIDILVPQGDEIVVSYAGMTTRTIKITKPLTSNIVLKDNVSMLDQVVVTGYGQTTKKRTTGSVAVVQADELKTAPLANLDQLLQGKIAGVDIKAISGRPGQAAKVRIRGTNTINGNAEPLWVVDGVPLQRDIPSYNTSQIRAGNFDEIFSNGISGINPNDIESVSILKDASAAAIYGSRAAGGVIVVTTKRGQEGKPRLSYSANLSLVTAPPKDVNLMDSKEKLAFEQELWDEFSKKRFENNDGIYPIVGIVGMIRAGKGKFAGLTPEQQDAEIARLGSHTTNWFDELFRNSFSQSHYLSLSGGSKKISYYASLGYMKNNGLVLRTDADRSNLNMKLDLKPVERLSVGINMDASIQNAGSPSLTVDAFKYAYFANPYERPYDENGNYTSDNTWTSLSENHGTLSTQTPVNGFNILRDINETSSDTKNFAGSVIGNLKYNVNDKLSLEGLASYSYTNNSTENYNGANTYSAWIDRPFDDLVYLSSKRVYSSITQSASTNQSYLLRAQLNYSNTFNRDHYVSLLMGSEMRRQFSKSIISKRYGYDPVSGKHSTPTYLTPDGVINANQAKKVANLIDNLSGQSILENAFLSYYISADYAYLQRYIVSLTARSDGSNSFGSKEQFNPTGSIGFSWNIDEEEFMQSIKPVISSLTTRVAMGYTGNINRTVSPYLIMTYDEIFRKTEVQSFRMGKILKAPNPHLRWEKTRDMKWSIDAGFFKERIHTSLELYDRHTYDAVTTVPVVSSTGFTTQAYNTSEILNRGMELTLSTRVIDAKDWKLTMSGNLSWNQNKLLKYDVVNPSVFGANFVGYPLSSVFTGKIEGIDKRLGIYTYKPRSDARMDTAKDRKSQYNYLFYIGTNNAPIYGGVSLQLRYKDLYVGVGGSYNLGGLVLNNIVSPTSYNLIQRSGQKEAIPHQINDLYSYQLNTVKEAVHRWTPENPITDGRPRIIDRFGDRLYLDDYMVTANAVTRASTLENVSYFRINSLSLGYDIPQKWVQKAALSSAGLNFTANNVLLLTNYSGIDPETPGAVYPLPQTFSLGLTLGF